MIKPYYSEPGIEIYHGDCRDILPHLPKVDLVLTDPPYGIGIRGVIGGNNKADVKNYGDFNKWDECPVDEALRILVMDKGKSVIWFGGNYYLMPPSKCWLVWDKQNSGNFADCELAWTNLNCPVRIKHHRWNGMIRVGNEERYHPTQKPLAVIKWAIELAELSDTILDPFMGSGTTLVAAKQLGRKAIGIEIEEKYVKIAIDRLRQEVLPLNQPSHEKQEQGELC